mmetsp:Transcript_126138/g.177993  ORF Transcript_126138/g.177993 Transcript_126138/m.177993 type:complete len:238 (-) Transcript_126138:164-877(-)
MEIEEAVQRSTFSVNVLRHLQPEARHSHRLHLHLMLPVQQTSRAAVLLNTASTAHGESGNHNLQFQQTLHTELRCTRVATQELCPIRASMEHVEMMIIVERAGVLDFRMERIRGGNRIAKHQRIPLEKHSHFEWAGIAEGQDVQPLTSYVKRCLDQEDQPQLQAQRKIPATRRTSQKGTLNLQLLLTPNRHLVFSLPSHWSQLSLWLLELLQQNEGTDNTTKLLSTCQKWRQIAALI